MKKDAKGNKLKEAIGTGIDHEHWKKVKEARAKNSIITFRCSNLEKEKFVNKANAVSELNESEVLRLLINGFINGKIKIK